MRSRVREARVGRRPRAAPARPRGVAPPPSAVITASCSADGLTGLVSSAATTARAGRARRPRTGCTTGIGASGRTSTDRVGERDAVHLGHVDVEDGEVEVLAVRGPSPAPRGATPSSRGRPSPSGRAGSPGCGRFVALSSTTSTRAAARSRPGPARRRRRRQGRLVDLDREAERAALAGDAAALGRQRAVHQLGQPAADREPEAGAAVAAARSTRRPG